MTISIDENGISTETAKEIRDRVLAKIGVVLEDDFVTEPSEPIPMIVGIVAVELANAQTALSDAIDALTPGSARGVFADNVAAITLTDRDLASASQVEADLHGTPSAAIPLGRILKHIASESEWETVEEVTVGGGGTGRTTLQSRTTGPVLIPITGTSGWTVMVGDPDLTGIENVNPSIPGASLQTDEQLEEKRIAELGTLGASTPGAIRGNLTQDTDVVSVALRVNATNDAVDGVPPGSVEAVVDAPATMSDQDIAKAMFLQIAAGVQPWGQINESFVDDDGVTRDWVRFSRVESLTVYVRVTLDTTGALAGTGDRVALTAAIQEAVKTKGDEFAGVGDDVIPLQLVSAVMATVPSGSVTSITVELSTNGTDWSAEILAVNTRQKPVYASERVTVLYTP